MIGIPFTLVNAIMKQSEIQLIVLILIKNHIYKAQTISFCLSSILLFGRLLVAISWQILGACSGGCIGKTRMQIKPVL